MFDIKYISAVLLGVLVFSQNGFSDLAYPDQPLRQSRELLNIGVTQGYKVAVDNDPRWDWSIHDGKNSPIFVAHSPDFYYPPTSVLISFFPDRNLPNLNKKIKQSAQEAITTMALNFGVQQDSLGVVKAFTFKKWHGFYSEFSIHHNGGMKDMVAYVGVNADGELMSMSFITLSGKSQHIVHVMDRLGNGIRFDL